ncbi:MAG: hypothetical protein LBK60_01485 [Verrucomicrobiales bacterium]|jgi:hypothetical protein|nr:hypothetical protein [Verrucomicrobiales bacterium]
MSTYAVQLQEIFTGADAGTARRWTACNFFDKVALAQESVPPQYWPGYGRTKPLPGLPPEERFAGIAAIAGHLVGWRGGRVRWCADGDFSTWIPVGQSAAVLRLTLLGGFPQPAAGGDTGWLWVAEPVDGLVPETFARIEQAGTHNFYSVAAVSPTGGDLSGQLAAPTAAILPGQAATLTLTKPQRWETGARVFLGGQTVPLRITAASPMETDPPTLTVTNEGAAPVSAKPAGVTVTTARGCKLTNLGLSGALPPQTFIPSGAVVVTETANDAGELVNVGGDINGDIWALAALGGQALVLKEWSVQLLQHAGRPAGFTVQPVLTGEGLLGRHAWALMPGGALFVGHREIYRYGAEGLQPVLRQVSREWFAALDRARLDEIFVFENEGENEMWLVAPAADGGTKVLVWNFLEDTAVFDDYAVPLTAAGMWDWQTDVGWDSLKEAWDDYDLTWNDLAGGRKERLLILGAARDGPQDGPELLVHGLDYARKGAAYRCAGETLLFDGGDDYVYKYGDSVKVNLQIKTKLDRPKRLWCRLGARESLDSDTCWSGADWVEVSGNSNPVAKFDLRASGRFLAVQFWSEQEDLRWRVAGLEINGRTGNCY